MPAIVVFSNQKCWNSPARENDTGKMSNFSLFIFRVVAILNVAIIASACQKSAESDLPKSPGNKADAPFYIRLNSSTRKFSMNDSSAHKTYYSSKSDDTFREYSSYTGRSGVTHKRFQQYYKNFKVENAVSILHGKNGIATALNGDYFKIKDVNTEPAISEVKALALALSEIAADKYEWENSQPSEKPRAELVIASKRFDLNSANSEDRPDFRLAYAFDIRTLRPFDRIRIHIDAHSGEVLDRESRIRYAPTVGIAATHYSGNQNITTESTLVSGVTKYTLSDFSRSPGITVKNLNLQTTPANATSFNDLDNNWNWFEYDNPAHDDIALDVFWAAEMTFDYFKTKHVWTGLDNNVNGKPIIGYVHYGVNATDAFWDGTAMYFGDGNLSLQPPVGLKGALDAVAHEYAHGINDAMANSYGHFESGAINEGLSDIWSACVENYVNGLFPALNKDIWAFEKEVLPTQGGMRSMSNPESLGQTDTYKGAGWVLSSDYNTDKGGVHLNSTVLSHWFYCLSAGCTGTNDFRYKYNVAGIGIEKAAQIVFDAESSCLTRLSGFKAMRECTVQSVVDFFGPLSPEYFSVSLAWDAAGVVDITDGNQKYCAAGSQWGAGRIGSVSANEIDQHDGAFGVNGYTDYSESFVAKASTAQANFEIIVKPYIDSDPGFWKIWIDFNHDGSYSDPGELVFTSQAASNAKVTANVSIPASAVLGFTKMRIMFRTGAPPATSCDMLDSGEVEDYGIFIQKACPAPASVFASSMGIFDATLQWSPVTGVSRYRLGAKEGSTESTATEIQTLGNTGKITGLKSDTWYYFTVQPICDNLPLNYYSNLGKTIQSGAVYKTKHFGIIWP